MPNSFTVFPNVLPGNVSIGGNLTVAGDQLRIGAAAPFIRLGKDVSQVAVLSYNLGFDSATLDTGADGAHETGFNIQGTAASFIRVNPAGARQIAGIISAILTDYTAHSHTGTVTQDTIVSKLIRGAFLGPGGGFSVMVELTSAVQGATATTINVTLGGTTFGAFSITAAGDYLLEVFVGNRNAQNSQFSWERLTNLTTGVITTRVPIATAVDTSVDQTLAFTITSGATTDQQTVNLVIAKQENNFGPV